MVVFTSQWCRRKLIIQDKAKLSSSPSAEALVFSFLLKLLDSWTVHMFGWRQKTAGGTLSSRRQKHLAGRGSRVPWWHHRGPIFSHCGEKWSEPKEEIRSFYQYGWSLLALQGRILWLGDVGKESAAAEQLRRWRRLPRHSGSMFDWHRKLLSVLVVSAKWMRVCTAEAARQAGWQVTETCDTTTDLKF